MRLGGLSTNFRFMMKKIIEDLKIYLTFFFGKKIYFNLFKKYLLRSNNLEILEVENS